MIYNKRSKSSLKTADMLANMAKAKEKNESDMKNEELHKLFESSKMAIGLYEQKKRELRDTAKYAITYKEHFTNLALTEALTYVVENSLLLNTEEYEKLNNNYKVEIKETIKSFLENAEINNAIENKAIIDLYEEITKITPPAELYLTEADEIALVNNKVLSNERIKRELDNMCRDVRYRVANIVSKDQEALAKEENDLAFIDNKEVEAAPVTEVVPQPVPVEDEILQDPENPVAPTEIPQPQPAQNQIAEACKSKSLNVRKNKKKKYLIETLMINEANDMLAEGKEYNSTLALANVIKFITVLESLDSSEIVQIGQAGYDRILSQSGVDLNPVSKVGLPGSSINDKPVITVPTEDKKLPSDMFNSAVDALPETKKEEDVRSKISDIIKMTMTDDLILSTGGSLNSVFEPFAEWKKNHKNNTEMVDLPEEF